MPRTLPWLKDVSKANEKPKKSPTKVTKRPRLLDPDTDDDALSTTGVSPRRKALSRVVRTPSTSPPPAPPSQEFMHPGLSADDIYMMVEDEFLAVAHTFTQHLHHAEYQRLKSLARTRATITVVPINRPTDSITAMRDETKRKKEAEGRHLKQTSALKFLHGKAAEARKRGSGSESDAGDKEDGVGVGTALHGLLTSPGKVRTSLGGLQGIKSSTRAAAGYVQSGQKSPDATRKKPSAPTIKSAPSKQSVQRESDGATTSDTDDDLDLPPPKPRQPPPSTKTHLTKPILQKPSILSSPPSTNTLSAASSTKPPKPKIPLPIPTPSRASSSRTLSHSTPLPSSKPPLPALIDNFPRPSPSKEDLSRRARKARRAKEEPEKKNGGGGISEIPMFLV